MKKKIVCQNGYIIYQIDENDIYGAVEFVVKTNYKKHKAKVDATQMKLEIAEILESERKIFKHSCFYMATTMNGQIIGTLRVLISNSSDMDLPDNVEHDSIHKVCHIGRFAIDQYNGDKLGNELFKQLVLLAFSHVCQHQNNILIAECDIKLHRVLRLMGIDIIKIGLPFFCLGSETISVYAPYKNIIQYYSKYNLLQQ
ncbi:hypothetical protein POZ03_01050 [Bacteroides uniformis]|uniref:hypothetical protein n=1 Tax=Bacteroides uniformis TaxID=820 RepID=UPI00233EFE83|nr:hypothetical protein [Bacteroides uniformis]MDC1809044.1 hypothetical protein [Bacteroides uniformis]